MVTKTEKIKLNDKKLLGTIVDSFTMQDVDRIILLDRDCSAELKVGDSVIVKFSSGQSTVVKVLDAFLEPGSKWNVKAEQIASLRVENIGFPNDPKSIIGSKVFLV